MQAAVVNEDIDSVKQLYQSNPNLINEADNNYNTPLHLACNQTSKLELVQLLIQFNSDINKINNNGETPLLCLVSNNPNERRKIEEIGRFLLKSGASLEAKNNQGKNAQQIAYEKGYHSLIPRRESVKNLKLVKKKSTIFKNPFKAI